MESFEFKIELSSNKKSAIKFVFTIKDTQRRMTRKYGTTVRLQSNIDKTAKIAQMSRGMRFPTMWYVRPAKAQTCLRIRAV